MCLLFSHYSYDRERKNYLSPLSVYFIFIAEFLAYHLNRACQHGGFLYLFYAYREIVSKTTITFLTALSGIILITDFMSGSFIDHLSYILHSVLAVTTLFYITYILRLPP